MFHAIDEVIGFDLGHGETALARATLEGNAEPEILEISKKDKKIITAIAYHPQRGVVIGEAAFLLPGTTRFQVSFKGKPSNDPTYQQTLRDFVQAVYQELVTSRQLENEKNYHFFIGCPSGWTEEERGAYQELLTTESTPVVSVYRESRAALMHARESGRLSVGELQGTIVVIDIGSSTTDFTLIAGRTDSPVNKDFGADLGAALIDKAILAYSIENHSDSKALKSLIDEHPHFSNRCELLCRKAKEEYFSDPDFYADETSQVYVGREDFQRAVPFVFEPLLNQSIMAELLNRPLAALNNKTWPQALRERISAVREELEEQGMTPEVVMMTGGASRMNFVWQICTEVFPESTDKQDSEPEYCIARGLARWGRVCLRTAGFEDEMVKLSHQVRGIVKSSLPELIDLLTEPLVDGLMETAIKPALYNWRAGRVKTLNDLGDHIADLAKTGLNGSSVKRQVTEMCAKWFDALQEDLDDKIKPICSAYGIPETALKLNIEIDPNKVIPDGINVDDKTNIEGATGLAAFIAAIIIATILGGSGTALLIAGPIGWIIGFVIGIVAAFGAAAQADEMLKKADLPIWMRRMVLSDNKIDTSLAEKKGELKDQVREMLTKEEVLDSMIEKVGQQLEKDLQAKVDEARLWVR